MSGETVFVIAYNSKTFPFITTIYLANGGYLTWIETDTFGMGGGSLQPLTSNVKVSAKPAEHLLAIFPQ